MAAWCQVVESRRLTTLAPTAYEPDAPGTLRFRLDNRHALWRAKEVYVYATDRDGASLTFDTPTLLPVDADTWTVVQHGLWGIHHAKHACVYTRFKGGLRISVPMGRVAVVTVRLDRVAAIQWSVRVQSHDIAVALEYKTDPPTTSTLRHESARHESALHESARHESVLHDSARHESALHAGAQDAATNTSLHMSDVLRRDAIENTLLKKQNQRLRTYSQECDEERRALRRRLRSTEQELAEKTRRTDELFDITLVSEKARAALREALVDSQAATAKTAQRLQRVQQDQSARQVWTRDVLPGLITSYIGPRAEHAPTHKPASPKRVAGNATRRRRRRLRAGALTEAPTKTRRRRCCAW